MWLNERVLPSLEYSEQFSTHELFCPDQLKDFKAILSYVQ